MYKSIFIILSLVFFSVRSYSQYDDPNVDHIPQELLDNYSYQPPMLSVVTASDGFDNFDLGVDFGEPHITTNPLNPLQYFVAYNTNGTHYTLNGFDWVINNPNFGVSTNGDPVTAYDSIGNLFYENLVGGVTGTRIIKSINNGQTWFASVAGNTGNDKNWIACDQTGGPFANYIYSVMTPGNFIRSVDHGATFTQTFTTSNLYPGMMVCVGPNVSGGNVSGGCVYVVTNTGPSAFAMTYNFFVSINGGASFTLKSSQNFANYVGTMVGGRHSVQNMRTRPYPMITADNSYGPFRGRFYVFYAANNPPGDGNKPDVYCRYSTNQGANWSDTIRVNDNPNPILSNQFFPAVWCDKQTGRLYCKWLDTRRVPTNDSMDVYASYSDNGGVSWATNQRITNKTYKIDCATCGGGGTPRYQGDYDAITSNNKTAMMAWTDFRNGNFGSYVSYFPDFALKVNPTASSINYKSDSTFFYLSVPAVKLYTDKVKFIVSISPPPSSGTFQLSFVNGKDSITSYPDSVRLRIKTIGGVTTGSYTINITAQGSNGTPVHKRTATLTVNQSTLITTLTLTTLIQGFYNNTNNTLNQRDTVTVYLRNVSSPHAIVDSAKGVIDSLTFTGSFDFRNAPTGTYYIVVKHRNTIETWSKNGGEALVLGGNFSYDFTTAISQAYGNNLILKGTRFCMYNGDANQDGFVDLSDLILISNDANAFAGGYIPTDINGDYITDLSDMIIAYNNSVNFVAKITPP